MYRLRNEIGFDVQDIISQDGALLERLLTDVWWTIEIVSLITEEQREARGISLNDFLDNISSGDGVDEMAIGILEASAEMLPKIQRQPVLVLIKKLRTGLDQAAEKITGKVEEMDLGQMIQESL